MSREHSCCLCHFLAIVSCVLIAQGDKLSVAGWAWCVQGKRAVAWGKLPMVTSFPAPLCAGLWHRHFGVTWCRNRAWAGASCRLWGGWVHQIHAGDALHPFPAEGSAGSGCASPLVAGQGNASSWSVLGTASFWGSIRENARERKSPKQKRGTTAEHVAWEAPPDPSGGPCSSTSCLRGWTCSPYPNLLNSGSTVLPRKGLAPSCAEQHIAQC